MLVEGGAEFEAEVGEFLGDIMANLVRAFADGGRENEGVNAAERGSHLADEILDAEDEESVGERSFFVAGVAFVDNVAQVVGKTGDAE